MTTLAEAGLKPVEAAQEPLYYNPSDGLECGALPCRPVDVPLAGCECRVCRAVRSAREAWDKPVPYLCPVCISRPEQYHGQLIFAKEMLPAYCSNHKAKIELVRAVL